MRKITQTIVGTTPPLDKNVIWLNSTNSTAPVEKVFINGQWTPTGVDTDDYYTKDEVDDKLDDKLNVIESPVNGNLLAMNSQGQATDSGKKISDFIATPEVAGQNGEVLSVDSEGNPVWTTVTPTGTADTEMSDSSTNAVQNKVIKAYVDDNCAKKDGYYSQMTVGSAENLVGQTVDSEAYLIRPTGGNSNEVANGVASVLGMEGNSAVWNQLIQNGDFSDGTITVWKSRQTGGLVMENGHANFVCKVSGANNSIATACNVINGHKYYIYVDIDNKFNGCRVVFGSNDVASVDNYIVLTMNTVSRYRTGILYTVSNSTSAYIGVNNYPYPTSEYIDNVLCSLYKLYVIDLTLLGIDNLTTTAQVEEWLAQHVGTKPYYAYNAGTILSAQTLGVKTYGQNLLNPETRQAKLIPYTWVENGTTYSNQYTIKNVPSGATATFTPDNTGVAETVDISGGSLDITSYGSGILELSAATANTYVCMKWNTEKDNDVVPYEDHTYDFDVRNIYGKVSGEGSYVQCYPDGMKSANTVHTILTASEAVDRTKKVDLGTLEWTLQDGRFWAILPEQALYRGSSSSNNSNVIISSSKYKLSSTYNINDKVNNMYAVGLASASSTGGMRIYIIDNSYSSSSDFTTAIRGTEICYETYYKKTYTDLIYRDGGIDRPLGDILMNIEVNNWSMEEQLMTPYENGNPTSIPATISIKYGMDAVEQIDTLNKTCYVADDVKANLQALLTCINTNCAETLGGTFSIGDPTQEDSKVFTFTFTPNTEPEP